MLRGVGPLASISQVLKLLKAKGQTILCLFSFFDARSANALPFIWSSKRRTIPVSLLFTLKARVARAANPRCKISETFSSDIPIGEKHETNSLSYGAYRSENKEGSQLNRMDPWGELLNLLRGWERSMRSSKCFVRSSFNGISFPVAAV